MPPKTIVELQDDLVHNVKSVEDITAGAEAQGRVTTTEEQAKIKTFLDRANQLS